MAHKKLTLKQDAIVEHYTMNGGNKKKAAISAGFSKKTATVIANRTLNLPHVAAAVEAKKNATAKKFDVSRKHIITKLKSILDDENDKSAARVSAAAELNKMCGFNAPIKSETDITSAGNALTAVVYFPAEEN